MAAEGSEEKKSSRRVLIYLGDVGSRTQVYDAYVAETGKDDSVSARTFFRIWDGRFSHVRLQCDTSDFCPICAEAFRKKEFNTPAYQAHLAKVLHERARRRELIKEAQDSNGKILHLTFDFAEPAEIPHCQLSTSLNYYAHPPKVQLFGIKNATGGGWVYLVPETDATAKPKGSSIICDMLFDFFKNVLGPHVRECGKFDKITLSADNCGGQNKNRTLMAFISMLADMNYAEEIAYHFLPVGHTKCEVDAMFGTVKKPLKMNDVHTLDELQLLIRNCTRTPDMIQSRMIKDHYNWTYAFSQLTGKETKDFRTLNECLFKAGQQVQVRHGRSFGDKPSWTIWKPSITPMADGSHVLQSEHFAPVPRVGLQKKRLNAVLYCIAKFVTSEEGRLNWLRYFESLKGNVEMESVVPTSLEELAGYAKMRPSGEGKVNGAMADVDQDDGHDEVE